MKKSNEDRVQEKDETAMSFEKIREALKNANPKAVEAILMGELKKPENEAIRERLMTDPNYFEEFLKQTQPQIEGEEENETEKQKIEEEPGSKVPGEEEVKEKEENQLQEPEGSEKELLKSKIEFLQEERIPELEKSINEMRNENLALKREIESFKTAPKEAPVKIEIKDFKIPKKPVPPDGDFMDEEYQNELIKYDEQIADVLSNLVEQNKNLSKKLSELETIAQEAKYKAETTSASLDSESKESSEFDEIDAMRKEAKSEFSYKRPTSEIESDFLDFLTNVKIISGDNTPLLDNNGNYTETTRKVIAEYFGKNGEELRKKCEKKGVVLPEDYGELELVYRIRNIRNNMAERDIKTGELKPLSYKKAFKIYLAESFDSNAERLKHLKRGHEEFDKAARKLDEAAKETPTESGAPPFDYTKYNEEQLTVLVRGLIKKGARRTEAENTMLLQILKDSKISEAEIKDIMATHEKGANSVVLAI